jgi:hypothetical protein
LQKKKYNAKPLSYDVGTWQTYSTEAEAERLEKIQGMNYYTAHSGAYTSPYGVFWVKVELVFSQGNLLNISNIPEAGKRKIPKVNYNIEPDLVFPVLRGEDIERWKFRQEIFALIVQDPKKRIGYDESLMKQKWPKTYNYLTRFKEFLISQAAYKKYHQDQGNPFYSQFNISEETFKRYKVIWNQMGNELYSCLISQTKTPFGYKPIIPLHTVAFFATNNESEAHYLCAIINSKPVRDYIKSFSSAGRGFGTPSVMKHVGIPKFDPKNPLHQRLAEISKKCHQLKAQGNEKEIEKLEEENDKLVIQLFEEKQSSNMTKS